MHLIVSVSLSSWLLSYLCQCSQQRKAAVLTAQQSLASQHALSQAERGGSADEADVLAMKNSSFLHELMSAPAELYQLNYSQCPGLRSDTVSFLRELKCPCYPLTHMQCAQKQHAHSRVAVLQKCTPPWWGFYSLTPSPHLPLLFLISLDQFLFLVPQKYLKINYLNKPAVRSGCQPLTPEVNNLFEIHYCVERCSRALQDSAFLSHFLSLHKLTTVKG